MALGNNPTPNELVKEVRNIGSNYVPKTITEGTITTGINNNGDEGLVAGTSNIDVSDTYSLMLKADNDDKSIRLESQTNSNIALVGVSTDGSAIMGVQDLSGSDSYTVISADLTNGVAVAGAAFTYNEENVLVESSLKTINNQSLVGSGNITIQGGSSGIVVVNSTATRIEVGEGAYLINIPVGNDEWALMVDKAFVQFNVDLSNIYSSITDNDIVYITHNLDLENLDVTGIISAFSNLDANSKAGMFLASEFENFGPGASWQFVGTITTIESDGDIYRSLYITSQVIPSGGGTSTDVQVNGTSITSNNVANLITNTAYNASSNKIATMSDLPSVPVTGIQVNGTSILSSGVANLITQNADYDASTNKLITNSDLGGYLKKKTVLSGDSTIYNEIDASVNYGGIILTSGDDYIEGNPATIGAALVGPRYILSQVMDGSNNVSFSQITSSNGTENYASTTTENNQEIQSNLIIQKETTGISISDEVIVTDTTSNETTTYAGTLDFKPTELEIGVPTITPKVTNTTNLGSSYAKFKDLYLAGNLSDGTNTLTLAGIQPKSDSTLNTTSKTVVGAINEIEGLVPAQANSNNQLADKNFVNSSINAFAAYYITRNAAGDPFRTKAELSAASTFYNAGIARTPTTNDYAIVLVDESQGDVVSGYSSFTSVDDYVGYFVVYNYEAVEVTSSNKSSLGITVGTTIAYERIPTTRYLYQGGTYPSGQWDFQYIVNNTSFTAAQLAALNSGITESLVTQIGTNASNVSSLSSNKADKSATVSNVSYDSTNKKLQETINGTTSDVVAFGANAFTNTAIPTITATSGSESVSDGTNTLNVLTRNTDQTIIGVKTLGNRFNLQTGKYNFLATTDTVTYANSFLNTTIIGRANPNIPSGYSGLSNVISIGHHDSTPNNFGNGSISLGKNASGENTDAIAIGTGAISTGAYSIQLGAGTNSTASTLQVGSNTLLDITTGKIPNARLNFALTTTSGSESITDGTNTLSFGANAFNSTTIPNIPTTTTSGQILVSTSTSGTLNFSTTYVKSINGSSGTITNVAKTNTAQTFSGEQTFNNNIIAYGELIAESDSGYYDDDWYAMTPHISITVPDTDQIPSTPTGDELPEANVKIVSTICHDAGENTIEYFIGPHEIKTGQYGTYFDTKDYNELILIGDMIKAYGGIRILDSANDDFTDDGGLITYDSSTQTFYM